MNTSDNTEEMTKADAAVAALRAGVPLDDVLERMTRLPKSPDLSETIQVSVPFLFKFAEWTASQKPDDETLCEFIDTLLEAQFEYGDEHVFEDMDFETIAEASRVRTNAGKESEKKVKTAPEEAEKDGKKPPLGTGERFKKLKAKIAAKGDVRDPGAVAAWIGRKKYGKARFQKLSVKGRKK